MIRGLVQGVGFRPFVFRTASQYGLFGEVDNRTDGISILVSGKESTIKRFSNHIRKHAPPASFIKSIEIKAAMVPDFDSFKIAPSRNTDDQITEVSPDIAVCNECLSDLEKDPFRLDYPLVNCTNCGPRFTIIEELPYDRHLTSMNSFTMCDACQSEYNDMTDRRFHAQPVSCNFCGPYYILKTDSRSVTGIQEILKEVSGILASGKTVAVKGVGGYHLMCDALNEEAVKSLRQRKQRDAKPFAVMFRDPGTLLEYCFLDEEEKQEIFSWRRPVVILRQKKDLAPSVNGGLTTTGALLPYMPFHYLFFRETGFKAVVLTSGNISDAPVMTDDSAAGNELGTIADAIVSYNRQIINRADDSVLRIIDKRPSLIRRSRGYAPRPLYLPWETEGILALGAEQKNTFCIGKGKLAVMSQHIGDLKNQETYDFFLESIERFSKLFRFRPEIIACDLHPDYLSARYAAEMSSELNVPLVKVQHHHAHIASCMAEYGIDEPVIGVSLDGTGLGTDNTIWGGEFMTASLSDFSRYTYFDPVRLPGGDRCVREPWRTACSYLYKYFGRDFDFMSVPSLRAVGEKKIEAVREMLLHDVNSPVSSGAGRLFDAISAILGLCITETFDSEAPMRLEAVIDCLTDDYYPFETGRPLTFAPVFKAILDDLNNKPLPLISAKFHNTIAKIILEVALSMKKETSLEKVILSGGVFQNKYLLEKTNYLLSRNGFGVYTNHEVPANDGNISLGQLAITIKSGVKCV